jgi:dolichyl-phosphate beta-glucosyltransferase
MLVVLPVYREAASVQHSVRSIARFAMDHPQFAFVFVDDGSPDDSALLIEQELRVLDIAQPGLASRVKLLRGGINRGKARVIAFALDSLAGTRSGASRSPVAAGDAPRAGAGSGDEFESPGDPPSFFAFLDGDLAYSPDHLVAMLEMLRTHDVVIGSRHMSEAGRGPQGLLRRVLGVGFNTLSRVALRRAYRDTQAGIKGFRLNAAREIFKRLTVTDFSFDVELLFIARKRGYSIGEMPANVNPAHRATPSSVRLFRDPARMFISLLRIRLNAWLGRYR